MMSRRQGRSEACKLMCESPKYVASLPIFSSVRKRRVRILQSLSGAKVRSRDSSANRSCAAEHSRAEGLLCPLGGVLPPGLGAASHFNRCVRAHSSAARPSVTARFATISQFRLVLRRFARDWRARHEQLSADDCHQPGPHPHQALWMVRADAELQHLRRSQRARGERSLLQSF